METTPRSLLQGALTKAGVGRLTVSNLHLIRGGSPLHSVVGGKHREGIMLPKEPTVGGRRQIT